MSLESIKDKVKSEWLVKWKEEMLLDGYPFGNGAYHINAYWSILGMMEAELNRYKAGKLVEKERLINELHKHGLNFRELEDGDVSVEFPQFDVIHHFTDSKSYDIIVDFTPEVSFDSIYRRLNVSITDINVESYLHLIARFSEIMPEIQLFVNSLIFECKKCMEADKIMKEHIRAVLVEHFVKCTVATNLFEGGIGYPPPGLSFYIETKSDSYKISAFSTDTLLAEEVLIPEHEVYQNLPLFVNKIEKILSLHP